MYIMNSILYMYIPMEKFLLNLEIFYLVENYIFSSIKVEKVHSFVSKGIFLVILWIVHLLTSVKVGHNSKICCKINTFRI